MARWLPARPRPVQNRRTSFARQNRRQHRQAMQARPSLTPKGGSKP
ncbi:hypothetical protein [Providencia sp. PROV058]|nr:hypothetical protein [Providencia sp. PROV058]